MLKCQDIKLLVKRAGFESFLFEPFRLRRKRKAPERFIISSLKSGAKVLLFFDMAKYMGYQPESGFQFCGMGLLFHVKQVVSYILGKSLYLVIIEPVTMADGFP